MAEPFLGEIRPFGFSFAPVGWATCDGQMLSIAQNTALFSLLGTTYGGDGRTTFALPDLRARVPTHKGADMALGERGGQESVTLTANEMASHEHSVNASAAAAATNALAGQVLAQSVNATAYAAAADMAAMNPTDVQLAGGGQPHDNMQPFLTVNYCIALQGIYPSRN